MSTGNVVMKQTMRFQTRFGRPPSWRIVAPGRVNLIGEHTDYQEGLVLPAATSQAITILCAPLPDARAEIVSEALDASDSFDTTRPRPSHSWSDYARGVVVEFRALTGEAPGFQALLGGNLPPGSGLSSSAALAVGICLVLESVSRTRLAPEDRAMVAHRAETRFVGVPSGIMDPFACALCRRDSAMLLDCRSRAVSHRDVPRELGRWVVVHSGIPRGLRESAYAERRAECERAVEAARTRFPEIRTLRDLRNEQLPVIEQLLEAAPFRRARHVVRENERVRGMIRALEERNRDAAGALLLASHRSLRDDFEVSLPELDTLVEISVEEGAAGARLMGAGFGGCTIHLVPPAAGEDWSDRVIQRYRERCGVQASSYPVDLSDGARTTRIEGR
jgi:galactokinase